MALDARPFAAIGTPSAVAPGPAWSARLAFPRIAGAPVEQKTDRLLPRRDVPIDARPFVFTLAVHVTFCVTFCVNHFVFVFVLFVLVGARGLQRRFGRERLLGFLFGERCLGRLVPLLGAAIARTAATSATSTRTWGIASFGLDARFLCGFGFGRRLVRGELLDLRFSVVCRLGPLLALGRFSRSLASRPRSPATPTTAGRTVRIRVFDCFRTFLGLTDFVGLGKFFAGTPSLRRGLPAPRLGTAADRLRMRLLFEQSGTEVLDFLWLGTAWGRGWLTLRAFRRNLGSASLWSFVSTLFPTTLGTAFRSSWAGPTLRRSVTSARALAATGTPWTAATSPSAWSPALGTLAGFAFLFTPLPRLERIPIRVFLRRTPLFDVACERFLGSRFASHFVVAGFFGHDDLFLLDFERVRLRSFLGRRLIQVEISAKVIVIRRHRLRGSRAATGRALLFLNAFLFRRTAGGFVLARAGIGRGRGIVGRDFRPLRLRRSTLGLVQGKVFRHNERVAGRVRSQIDAEQVFGQRFPRILFATSARARRICIHSRNIPVGLNPCKSRRRPPSHRSLAISFCAGCRSTPEADALRPASNILAIFLSSHVGATRFKYQCIRDSNGTTT
jgi:hypothetical protein